MNIIILYFFNVDNFVFHQVKVSNSRQQMVGHLLRDIVESSEKPNLTCTTDPKYDRFGFKIDADGSLEEKAERLQRVAQENLEECMEDVESRWNNVVTILGKPAQFTVTMDVKKLIRGGIPINQRGLVWKAIVDNRIRGSMDRPQPDYYQDLLSNYNPGDFSLDHNIFQSIFELNFKHLRHFMASFTVNST